MVISGVDGLLYLIDVFQAFQASDELACAESISNFLLAMASTIFFRDYKAPYIDQFADWLKGPIIEMSKIINRQLKELVCKDE